MAINFSTGFDVRSIDPIDRRFVLSKKEMFEERYTSDNTVISLPPKYFCICKDDNKIYCYDANNARQSGIGKFRPLSTETFTDIVIKGLTYAQLEHDGNPVQVQSAIEDENGTNIANAISKINSKQNKLIPGAGINIDGNNIISSDISGVTYPKSKLYTKDEINSLAQEFSAEITNEILASASTLEAKIYNVVEITLPSEEGGQITDDQLRAQVSESIANKKDIIINSVKYSYLKVSASDHTYTYSAVDYDPAVNRIINRYALIDSNSYVTLLAIYSSGQDTDGYVQFRVEKEEINI